MDAIQDRYEYLEDVLIKSPQVTGWVNGSLYKQTAEVSGILPIPDDVCQESGMVKFVPLPPDNKKQRHQFLAQKQGVQKAALPIHTEEERNTFRKLMCESTAFGRSGGQPNWKEVAKVWNTLADENDGLGYKVWFSDTVVPSSNSMIN
jgi:hypothetical protein